MPRSPEELVERIVETTRSGFRGRLLSRGFARSLIWSNGELPPGSPPFSALLTSDLLSYALGIFSLGLQLRAQDRNNPSARNAFVRAGEAIECVVRDGDPEWRERGFYTLIGAAAYHLGHFSARAYSLFPSQTEVLNMSPTERLLSLLLRRDLVELRASLQEVAGEAGFDAALAEEFAGVGEMDSAEAIALALNAAFHRALAIFDFALETGHEDSVRSSIELLKTGADLAGEGSNVPLWWIFTISVHLLEDLWDQSMHVRLPDPPKDSPDSDWPRLRRLFIAKMFKQPKSEVDLWPSQLSAAERAFDMSDDLVAALPTSAGKTRIAEICILRALSLGVRVAFVTPLRALSAQTERTLRQTFGPLGFTVSSLYGSSGVTGEDTDSLRNRDVVVSTPEKLDFALRNDPSLLDTVGLIVLDEAHTIGTTEREVRYEVLVQRLLRRSDADKRRIVCLSAILPQGERLKDFVSWIRQDQEGTAITVNWRPTRQRLGEIAWLGKRAKLSFHVEGAESEAPYVDPFVSMQPPKGGLRTSIPRNLRELSLLSAWRLVAEGQTVLLYCPERRSVLPSAEQILDLHRRGYLPSVLNGEKTALTDALNIGREWLGANHPAVECLKIGVAVHHGQLPRPFLRAVERLLRQQVLKVTVASPTLAQGLNLSATTVLFFSLTRGGKLISGEEFANVAGRAGRAYVDLEGQVLCAAWEKKHLRNWDRLLKAARERNLKSGLLQLVIEFCERIKEQKGYSIEKVIEYVTGNAKAWESPYARKPQTKEEIKAKEAFDNKWQRDVACLDSAILSLVQQDVPLRDLAAAVDTALQSSLWERSMAREDDSIQKVANAILLARTTYIWKNSTALQRKGYFFAGVSFVTGRHLDEHEEDLNRFLDVSDKSFAKGEIEMALKATIQFARIVFKIPPFQPDENLSNGWDAIVRSWILGESMSDLAGQKDAKMLEFIEGALVYRLVWAMEAVRVKRAAKELENLNPDAGRAALAIETGTPNYCAALLIQCGLASRIAAVKVVAECDANFSDIQGLRRWLASDTICKHQGDPEWPTPETFPLWRDFVAQFETVASSKWEALSVEIPVTWKGLRPQPGTPLRLFQNSDRVMSAWTNDFECVGTIAAKFAMNPAGVFWGSVSKDAAFVKATYLGPSDLFERTNR